MVEFTYQLVLSTLQTVALVVGITYYLFIMRSSQRNQKIQLETRQTQIFMQIVSKINTREALEFSHILRSAEWSNYEEWRDLFRSDREYLLAFSYWGNTYESLGVVLRDNIGGVRLLALHGSSGVLGDWERHREVIYEERKRRGNRRYFDMWEYTYDSLVRYLEEHPELKP